MKKMTYFWRARPYQKKVICNKQEYIIDETLAKKDTILYSTSVACIGAGEATAYLLSNGNIIFGVISGILIGCITQTIRYFILPKDIDKHLVKIEKGE